MKKCESWLEVDKVITITINDMEQYPISNKVFRVQSIRRLGRPGVYKNQEA